ncbi:MAG: hypothetical protein QOG00_2860 [Pyrinomonadaceae bacterium]|nr:hypothetical protein [Pyrinomonadaceae bacterium]
MAADALSRQPLTLSIAPIADTFNLSPSPTLSVCHLRRHFAFAFFTPRPQNTGSGFRLCPDPCGVTEKRLTSRQDASLPPHPHTFLIRSTLRNLVSRAARTHCRRRPADQTRGRAPHRPREPPPSLLPTRAHLKFDKTFKRLKGLTGEIDGAFPTRQWNKL